MTVLYQSQPCTFPKAWLTYRFLGLVLFFIIDSFELAKFEEVCMKHTLSSAEPVWRLSPAAAPAAPDGIMLREQKQLTARSHTLPGHYSFQNLIVVM